MADKIASNYAARIQQRLLEQQRIASNSRAQNLLLESPLSSAALTDAKAASMETQEVSDITASAIPSPNEIQHVLNEVEALLAVSGRVQPDALFAPQIALRERQEVLSQLAPRCVIETHTGQVLWLLRPDQRREVLLQLWKSDQLEKRLAPPLPDTDRFGDVLRQVLRLGESISLEDRTLDDLVEMSSIVELLAGTGIAQPDVRLLRQQVGRESFLKDYRLLLTNGIWGREAEMQQLRNFVTDSTFQRAYYQAPTFVPWSGLLLTGLGGAGKSTLLAQFILDTARDNTATIVILDFDRPGIEPNDLPWLEAEISRQVGQQFPEVAELLRDIRHEARQDSEDSYQLKAGPESVSADRSVRYLLDFVYNVLLTHAGDRPFLLVLDTFEEVVQRGLAEQVLEWLSEIVVRLQNIPLKVIISGRVLLTPEEEARDEPVPAIFQNSGVTTSLYVGELDSAAAEQFLIALQVHPEMAHYLAFSDVLPRRPLELKLLARLVTQTSHKDSSIKDLERELREGGSAAGELFAGLVYRRVLLRVDDSTPAGQTVTRLAYPGLVLRFLTPQLIHEVLVPALNLAPLTENEALEALDSLASYNWMAYRESNGAVWHRRDLRRSMLKAMRAHEPKLARQISTKAVEFFTARYNRESDQRDYIEALYHRLALVQVPEDGENFNLNELSSFRSFIGPDEADLPPAAVALLNFATGRPVSEAELLPRRYLGQIYHQTGQDLISNREFGKALALYRRYRGGGEEESISAPTETWERNALFATVTWDELVVRHDLPVVQSSAQRGAEILNWWITYWFIFQVAIPEILDDGTSSFLVDHIFGRESEPLLDYSLSENSGLLHRLATALLLSTYQQEIDSDTFEDVTSRMLEFWMLRQKSASLGLDVVPRRLLFLELARSKSEFLPRMTVNFSPSTLKLDAAWINQFTGEAITGIQGIKWVNEEALNLANRASQILNPIIPEGVSPPTARTLLGAIDDLSNLSRRANPRALSIDIDWFGLSAGTFLDLFRGPDPEFRDPCRFALLEAYPDRVGRERLAGIIASLLTFQVADLSPDVFAEALVFRPEHALELYVELVDRAWLLGQLLRRAHEDCPEATKLARILAAYERWDAAVRGTIEHALA